MGEKSMHDDDQVRIKKKVSRSKSTRKPSKYAMATQNVDRVESGSSLAWKLFSHVDAIKVYRTLDRVRIQYKRHVSGTF